MNTPSKLTAFETEFPVAAITQYATEAIHACVAQAKKEFDPHFELDKATLTFAPKFKMSVGGIKYNYKKIKYEAFIRLALAHYLRLIKNNRTLFLNEYNHICTDSKIGSVGNATLKKVIYTLVAHEIAHAVQFHVTLNSSNKTAITDMESAIATGEFKPHPGRGRNQAVIHGRLWQYIYRRFREEHVNGLE